MTIRPNCLNAEAVSYSGPTYIAIHSAKHNSSSTLMHNRDLKRLHDLKEFKQVLYTEENQSKPIVIITVDGGPDVNPRYVPTIASMVDYFRTYNLDAGCPIRGNECSWKISLQ